MQAIVLSKSADSVFSAQLSEVSKDTLTTETPNCDSLVKIDYSCLNYKDALAICNKSPVVRKWPMIAGIDGAGTIDESSSPDWKKGDRFVINGWGLGETSWGCLAQQARLRSECLVRLPDSISSETAMAIGTAGYTAMLCALALRDRGVKPQSGEILVTGAAGGVGSVAIAILAGWGYKVVACTGRASETTYLTNLGAQNIIGREELSNPGKALQKERWAGVVDCVGSHTLANACAQTSYGGVVTACGLAQGMDLPSSVAPFILRGVSLIGIDSVMAPIASRQRAWDSFASEFDLSKLELMIERITPAQVIEKAAQLMAGQVRGRVVVDFRG
jgi:acrylyl-CoA reductase (NADPH)